VRSAAGGRLDPLAAAVAAVACAMAAWYVVLMRAQGDRPVTWALSAMLAGTVLAGYGAGRTLPYRRAALAAGGAALAVVGLLAILSIGAPLVLAGGTALLRAARGRGRGPEPEHGPGGEALQGAWQRPR
jgi:hypothetical protein